MQSGRAMVLAATAVVLMYMVGVIVRRSTAWWEWLAALAGLAFAVWFWFTEFRRAAERRGKDG